MSVTDGPGGSPPEWSPPSVHDHLRATAEDPLPPGVYRVVGVDDDRVTLLAVTDDSGTRAHTGRLEHLDRETVSGLRRADDPDAGLGRLRQVPKAYRVHPWLTALGVGGVVAGALARAALIPLSPDLGESALFGGAAMLVVMAVQAMR